MILFVPLLLGSAAVALTHKLTKKKKGKKELVSYQNVEKEMSPMESEAKQQQIIASSGLALFSLGAVFSPLITLAGLPFIAYNYYYLITKYMLASYRHKKNIITLLFDGITLSVALIFGYYLLASFLFLVFFTAQRLIARTEREAQTDFSRIFGDLSDTVWLLKDGVEIEVPLDSIQVEDTLIINVGEMIPVDGQICGGEGMVDQHLLTGEAQPIEKKSGDKVLTSTLLISGKLQVVVEKTGTETITGQIAKTLEHSATFKHRVQSRGEHIVDKGASRTMIASAAALPLIGLNHAMALTYSGFGYQMRLAAPLIVVNYLRIAAQRGILIKDGRALDQLSLIDTVIFDKTGTLTEEVPQVGEVFNCDSFTKEQVLQYAASVEKRQKHPIALAICDYANKNNITTLEQGDSDYVIGHGLRVELIDPTIKEPLTVLIGSCNFMKAEKIKIPKHLTEMQSEAGDKGYSVVYIALSTGVLVGAIQLRPTVRPNAKKAIKALHDLGMTLYIISGDQEQPTRYLASELGIDHYFAETMPNEKAQHIADLQAEGHKICFIGDGINDSVALQKADVSISLHGAATIAQDTAEIVLITPDLCHLPYLVNISNEFSQRMNRSELLNTGSGVACVSSVLLLGMGLGGAIVLYAGGIMVNIGNAMLPLLTHKKDK